MFDWLTNMFSGSDPTGGGISSGGNYESAYGGGAFGGGPGTGRPAMMTPQELEAEKQRRRQMMFAQQLMNMGGGGGGNPTSFGAGFSQGFRPGIGVIADYFSPKSGGSS